MRRLFQSPALAAAARLVGCETGQSVGLSSVPADAAPVLSPANIAALASW